MYNALIKGKIAGVGLDVYDIEPPNDDFFPRYKELIGLENVICTPHIGGNSEEAVLAMGRSSIRLLKDINITTDVNL